MKKPPPTATGHPPWLSLVFSSFFFCLALALTVLLFLHPTWISLLGLVAVLCIGAGIWTWVQIQHHRVISSLNLVRAELRSVYILIDSEQGRSSQHRSLLHQLHRTGMLVEKEQPPQRNIQQILREIGRVLRVERCHLWVAQSENPVFTCVCAYDSSRDEFPKPGAGIAQAHPDYVAGLRSRSLIPPGAGTKPSDSGTTSDLEAECSSSWQVGIFDREQLIAVLCLEVGNRERDWSASELLLIEALAGLINVALIKEEKRRTQTALGHSETRYRLLAELSPDAILLHSQDRIVYANPACRSLFGVEDVRELLTRKPLELFHADCRMAVEERILQTLDRGITTHTQEERILSRAGGEVVVETSRGLLRQENETLVLTLMRDLGDRRLREARWKALVECNPDSIMLVDRDTTIHYINRVERGFDPVEVIGSRAVEFVVPEHRIHLWNCYEKVWNAKEPLDFEVMGYGAEKQKTWYATRLAPVLLHGETIGMISVSRNITEKKEAERLIRESEDRFRSLIELAPDGIVILQDLTITYANAAFLRIIGADFHQQVIDQCMLRFVPEEDHGLVLSRRRLLVENRGPMPSREGRYIRVDGTQIDVEVANGAYIQGGKTHVQLIVRDITHRKQAEERLRQSEARFRGLYVRSPDAVFIENHAGVVLDVNPAACRLHGSTREQLIGKHVLELVPERHHDEVRRTFPQVRSGRLTSVEGWSLTADRKEVPVEIAAASDIYWGEPAILLVVRDVTERKQMESDIRKAKEIAEEANRAKSEFLAVASHEIRTPMHGILGLAELTLETTLTSQQRNYLELIRSSTESLLHILNDLLEFSRIEVGKLELSCEVFDLIACLEHLTSILEVRACRKNLLLKLRVSPDVPHFVVGDRGKLEQVITNLLANAVKFTDRGEICLSLTSSRIDEQDNLSVLHFSVSDTGVGIPREALQSIFEPFVQADTSIERRYGGAGLGLSISSELVKLMGGNLGVESTLGLGSTFHFTLQFRIPDEVPNIPTSKHHPRGRSLRILIADDDPASRMLLEHRLTSWGHEVESTSDGRESLEILAQRKFDLVILDLSMPIVGGIETVKTVRKYEGIHRHTRAIAITAGARADDREACLRAGFDGYLTKPLLFEELEHLLRQLDGSVNPTEEQRNRIAPKTVSSDALVLDEQVFTSRCLGKEDLKRNLIGLVQEQIDRVEKEIDQALVTANAVQIALSAHRVRGTALHIGANGVARTAARLEDAADRGDLQTASVEFTALKQELARLRSVLKQQ